jgi:hypothetical protein
MGWGNKKILGRARGLATGGGECNTAIGQTRRRDMHDLGKCWLDMGQWQRVRYGSHGGLQSSKERLDMLATSHFHYGSGSGN